MIVPSNSKCMVTLSVLQCVIGVGFFLLPYATKEAGMIPSLTLMLLYGTASMYTTLRLIQVTTLLQPDVSLPSMVGMQEVVSAKDDRKVVDARTPETISTVGTEHDWLLKATPMHGTGTPPSVASMLDDGMFVSYLQLCVMAFGEIAGLYVLLVPCILTQWLSAVMCEIFISRVAHQMFGVNTYLVDAALLLLACVIVSPKTGQFILTLSTIGFFSLVTFLFLTCITVIHTLMHTFRMPDATNLGLRWFGNLHGILDAFGITALSFSAHPEILSLFSACTISVRRSFRTVLCIAFGCILVLNVTFTLTIYGTFGEHTAHIVLQNVYEGKGMIRSLFTLLWCGVFVILLTKFILSIYPIFHLLETTIINANNWSWRLRERYFLTLLIILSATFVSTKIHALSMILGGLACVTSLLLPCLFAMKLQETSYIDISVALLGLISTIVSIGAGLIELTHAQ